MKALQEAFGITINDKALFKQALTHPSYTKENNISPLKNYERLEFLGDAVLKLTVSNILLKKYPTYSEGELTKIRSIIVSDAILAKIAKKLNLDKFIIMSKTAEKSKDGYRDSVLACTFEAILGAYFIEGKSVELTEFLTKTLTSDIECVEKNPEKYHAKEALQEYTQLKSRELPIYRLIKEFGAAHDPTFEVEVIYCEEVLATAKGKTKKEAEQKCAYKACLKLGVINK